MNPCTVSTAAADESFRILTMMVLKGFCLFIALMIVGEIGEYFAEKRRIARGEEPCLYI